jgi:hypothetical protein
MSNLPIPLIGPPANAVEVWGTPVALPPWFAPIPGSIWFDATAIVNIPANGPANVVTVVSQQIPPGYSGLVRKIANVALYGGFVDGSGWLIWQIFIDNFAVRNYGNITAQLGATNAPSETWIEVPSGSTVSWLVQSAIQAPPGGAQTVCRLSGWYWPSAME